MFSFHNQIKLIFLFFIYFLSCFAEKDSKPVEIIANILKDTGVCNLTNNCEQIKQCLEQHYSIKLTDINEEESCLTTSVGQSSMSGFIITLSCNPCKPNSNWRIDISFLDTLTVYLSEMEKIFGNSSIKKWSQKIKSGNYVEFNTSQLVHYSKFNIVARSSFREKNGDSVIKSIIITYKDSR